ncbi:MAG: hypothetical protein MUP04_09170, partial [Anaerolineae bacterium]|nr:hypothetical protein [Anaerolineae bacterium]
QIKAGVSGFWGELRSCRNCPEDEVMGESNQREPIFVSLPTNLESPPYTYLFLALEPSTKWAKDEADARAKIGQGFANFHGHKPT